jgi:hypothetical protein
MSYDVFESLKEASMNKKVQTEEVRNELVAAVQTEENELTRFISKRINSSGLSRDDTDELKQRITQIADRF